MVKKLVVLTWISFCFSCSSSKFPYDKSGLTYKGKFSFKKQIKMEGYFYHLDNNNTRIHYFFENGYYTGGGKEFHTINDLCPVIDSVARKIPYGWGCYIIERDTLKVQLISPNGRGKYGKFMVAERWAKIEDNGATLRYFQEKNIDGKVKIIDDVFKFHPCQNKPASTNILMED